MSAAESTASPEFEAVEATHSGTHPVLASAVRKGDCVAIRGFPCRVHETAFWKTGKHGHGKVGLVGTDIFTGKKYEAVSPSDKHFDAIELKRSDLTLINISDDGYAAVLLPDGTTREDMKVPEGEEGYAIRATFAAGAEVVVTVISAIGTDMIVGHKVVK
eukprot:m51a1_g1686 putative eukaryotic translation initiation factor 5a- (160) ;mRNA; f:454637-455197